ncbi:MAG: AIR synthase-related protein, partial [Armatimonadota bacterium]
AGATAVAEAMRNVAAIGATPSGLTDCLNFGNPENPQAFWEFREAVRGLSEAAKNLWLKGHEGQAVPVISGNVSFYNESATGRAVLPSPIITCVGIMRDYTKAVTMQLVEPGNALILLGKRYDELGGSEYYRTLLGQLGRNVPRVRWETERANIYTVIDAIDAGLVRSCHDISNGGLVCTLAEMAMGGYASGRFGARVHLDALDTDLRDDKALFSESGGFVLEVRPDDLQRLRAIAATYAAQAVEIGRVTEEPTFEIRRADRPIIRLDLSAMKSAWTRGLSEALQ